VVRSLRATVAAAIVATSLSLAPTPAQAVRLSSDSIDGVKLSSGRIDKTEAPDIDAKSGVLVDSSGRVLWARKAGTERPMASTTKIMTALIVLERRKLTEKVKITKTAARTPYATGLRTGERVTVRKLLELLLVCSSNDAATALAIHTGGSVNGFTKMMNARAKKLGMADTKFKNPHGLDAKGHHSSPRDLSRLMHAASTHKEFRRIIKLRSVKLPRYKSRCARTIRSTDKLLGKISGLQGGKTGFTGKARYCFVGSATRSGIALTSVTLGSPTSAKRFTSSKRLLEWGFKHYRIKKLCSGGQRVGSLPVSGETTRSVAVQLAGSSSAPVLDLLGPVERIAELPASIDPGVEKGATVGAMRFVQNARVIATVGIVTAEPVESTATP
jgi:D-alanyl-D-alanine carboxypeptidase (penicillin-binding protein 5/6)